MKLHHSVRSQLFTAVAVSLVVSLLIKPALAQNIPLAPTALPPAAQAALAAKIKVAEDLPTPRTADKHPVLSGYWELPTAMQGPPGGAPNAAKSSNEIRLYTGTGRLEDGNARMRAAVAARRADTSLRPRYKTPELAAKAMANFDAGDLVDPTFGCRLPGVQRLGVPQEIIASDKVVALLYSDMITAFGSNRFRLVPTDGRKHDPNAEPMVMGYAIGHWQGDTFVVVTKGFTDDTWIDHDGSFHSENMVYTENFTRHGNSLRYEAMIEDPYFLEPFKMPTQTLLLATADKHVIEEYPCIELSRENMVNGEKH